MPAFARRLVYQVSVVSIHARGTGQEVSLHPNQMIRQTQPLGFSPRYQQSVVLSSRLLPCFPDLHGMGSVPPAWKPSWRPSCCVLQNHATSGQRTVQNKNTTSVGIYISTFPHSLTYLLSLISSSFCDFDLPMMQVSNVMLYRVPVLDFMIRCSVLRTATRIRRREKDTLCGFQKRTTEATISFSHARECSVWSAERWVVKVVENALHLQSTVDFVLQWKKKEKMKRYFLTFRWHQRVMKTRTLLNDRFFAWFSRHRTRTQRSNTVRIRESEHQEREHAQTSTKQTWCKHRWNPQTRILLVLGLWTRLTGMVERLVVRASSWHPLVRWSAKQDSTG